MTATRGEHGSDDPRRWPPDRLARTRDLEIAAAMAILGVDEHRCLGFEDGTLADRAHAEGVGLVGELIDEVDPDTIVTFGPRGDDRSPRPPGAGGVGGQRVATRRPARPLLQATTTDRFATEFADVHEAAAGRRVGHLEPL